MQDLNDHISQLRNVYIYKDLQEKDIQTDPLSQFKVWLKEAIESNVSEPNTMVLATVSSEGKPSARVVLLKDINEKGLTFYTNYNSRKAREIANNPNAAM